MFQFYRAIKKGWGIVTKTKSTLG